MIVYELEGGAEEVGEDGCGDGAGAGLLAALTGHEAEEGRAGAGYEGEGDGEVPHLAGGLAVLHGVEVAFGGAGAGASAAAGAGLGGAGAWAHGGPILGLMFCDVEGDLAGGLTGPAEQMQSRRDGRVAKDFSTHISSRPGGG